MAISGISFSSLGLASQNSNTKPVEDATKEASKGDNKLLTASLAAIATITAVGVLYCNRGKLASILKKGEKKSSLSCSHSDAKPAMGVKPPKEKISTSEKTLSQVDDVIIDGGTSVSHVAPPKVEPRSKTPNYDDVILEEGAKSEIKTGYQRPPRKVFYKNGIALDPVKIRRLNGEIEETSSQGHRLITTYKDGLIEKRKFIPAKGNIKEIEKTYSYYEPFKEIVTKTVSKNGEVTYKYTADFLDKVRLPREFRGFMDLKFGETLGAPSKIHKNGNKTIHRYTDGYTIEHIDKGDTKQIKLFSDGFEIIRRNFFKSGNSATVINKKGSFYSVAKDKKGNFKWANISNASNDGTTTIFAYKQNGTITVVKRNSADEIVQKDIISLENQLPSTFPRFDKYDFVPPIDKNVL